MKKVIPGEKTCEGCGHPFVMKENQTLCKGCQQNGNAPKKHKPYIYEDISKSDLKDQLDEVVTAQKLLIDKVNKLLVLNGSKDIEDKPKGYQKTCKKCDEVFYAAAPATQICSKCKNAEN